MSLGGQWIIIIQPDAYLEHFTKSVIGSVLVMKLLKEIANDCSLLWIFMIGTTTFIDVPKIPLVDFHKEVS